tara:strand:+ start:11652 stop:13286 length:1635 start_codon:yes stop_codon:yes gene_type:complete
MIVDVFAITTQMSNISLTPAILQLPNEILDAIASLLTDPQRLQVMEGIGLTTTLRPLIFHWPRSSIAARFTHGRRDLCRLALVCRRFHQIAERLLYVHISLPHPEGAGTTGLFRYPWIALPYLVRTLLERPDLAARITSLDLWIRDRRLIADNDELDLSLRSPYYSMFKAACDRLSREQATFSERVNWSKELYQYQEAALHAFVITLLPQLRDLKLYAPVAQRKQFLWHGTGDRPQFPVVTPIYSYFDVALRNSSLTTLYVGVPFPIKSFPTASLQSMEIDMFFFGDRLDWLTSPTILPNVKSVTAMINLPLLNGNKYAVCFPDLDPRIGLQIFLRDMVPNIEKFAALPPRGTFPHCPGHVDKRGLPLPEGISLFQDVQDMDVNPMFDPSNDRGDWDWLLEPLQPVRQRLRSLVLPQNWHSATGNVKPVPSFRHFRCLESLFVPKVAVVANPHGEGYDVVEHGKVAVDVLPRSLKSLGITQVDTKTCKWVQDAFDQKERFPHLEQVELVFEDDFAAVLSCGFEEAARKAGVEVKVRWRGESMLL